MDPIRKYRLEDKAAVEAICLDTQNDELFREALKMVFCTYYITEEPENCFVATDENDSAVGYVLCAADFCHWENVFCKNYIEKTANPIAAAMGRATIEILQPFSEQYPAHLHIDLLPEYQGRHLGSDLLDALKVHLQQKGVPGLMLDVAADNNAAQRFYEKNGFAVLSATEQEYVMGIKLV